MLGREISKIAKKQFDADRDPRQWGTKSFSRKIGASGERNVRAKKKVDVCLPCLLLCVLDLGCLTHVDLGQTVPGACCSRCACVPWPVSIL